MKAIKWAGAGASLLDPVYAHLIAPKYEHELPPGNGKCEYFGAGLRGAKRQRRLLSTDRSGSVDCRRHGAILAFIRGEAALSAA